MNEDTVKVEDQKTDTSDTAIQAETEDIPLPPPEDKNDANEVNAGNIIGLIMIGVLVIFIIAFVSINLKNKGKKEKENPELDKAGSKTVIEFKEQSPQEAAYPSYGQENEEVINVNKDEDINRIIENLPEEIALPAQGEPEKAPVTPAGSTSSSYKSDRPDTRNSRSPRKIEGIGGLPYSENKNAASTIASALNGSSSSQMTREEYIASHMAQTQSLQNSLYGSSGTASTQGQSSGNKEAFYSAGNGNSGGGQWLSPATLWDGTIISGALVTAINTDNPGTVIARVTENVYSSYDHRHLLIPEGSLLMATYNSSVSYGQQRVQVAWNLLIRPDNYRITLGNMNGVDSQGASGYKGSVSNHPFETAKALGLVAVFSLIQTEVANDISSQNNEYLKNAMTDVYSQSANMGNRILDKALDIQPTIKIREGTEIKFITNVPLELPPVEQNAVNEKYVRTRK